MLLQFVKNGIFYVIIINNYVTINKSKWYNNSQIQIVKEYFLFHYEELTGFTRMHDET